MGNSWVRNHKKKRTIFPYFLNKYLQSFHKAWTLRRFFIPRRVFYLAILWFFLEEVRINVLQSYGKVTSFEMEETEIDLS